MSICLTAVIKSKPECREEVMAVLQKMVTATRKEEACIQYDLHQGVEDGNLFVFYEIWRDQRGLDRHNSQPYMLAFGELANDSLQEAPQMYVTNKL